MVIPKWYDGTDRYWNITFHWLNQYNLQYEINSLTCNSIIGWHLVVFSTEIFRVEILFLPTFQENKRIQNKTSIFYYTKMHSNFPFNVQDQSLEKKNHISFYYETCFDNIYGWNTQILSFTNHIKIIFIILLYLINYFN